jgi:hypothetical protein
MKFNGFNAFYFESFPVDKLNAFDIPEKEGVKTGGMSAKSFLALVKSIEENGLINPIIVERANHMTVAIGNNRVWALRHLGISHAKIVLFAKPVGVPEGGELIPNNHLEARMAQLHPGDDSWIHSQIARWIRRTSRQDPLE